MSKLEAMREAQLWLLDNPDALRGLDGLDQLDLPDRTPPFYWAAWVLSSDWE